MNALPKKPDAVAHVSDSLWEAALQAAWGLLKKSEATSWCTFELVTWSDAGALIVIEHARCLILLGEVVELVDPIEEAIEAAWRSLDTESLKTEFNVACRKHFSGLTFPVIGQ